VGWRAFHRTSDEKIQLGLGRKNKRGFGTTVREPIARSVTNSATTANTLCQTLRGPCRKIPTTSVRRTPYREQARSVRRLRT